MASAWGKAWGASWGASWGSIAPPQPPAPSGGLSWLRDYKPKFDYEPKPPARQREEEEALLMLALA